MKKAIAIILTISMCILMGGCSTSSPQSGQSDTTATISNVDTSGCIDPSIIQDLASETATP